MTGGKRSKVIPFVLAVVLGLTFATVKITEASPFSVVQKHYTSTTNGVITQAASVFSSVGNFFTNLFGKKTVVPEVILSPQNLEKDVPSVATSTVSSRPIESTPVLTNVVTIDGPKKIVSEIKSISQSGISELELIAKLDELEQELLTYINAQPRGYSITIPPNIQPLITRVETLTERVTSGAGNWGSISGTLSDQTDLQNALDGKLSLTTWFATTTPIAQGGTGLSTIPSYGQILLGNAAGGYDLVATSSLGISAGASTQWLDSGSDIYFNTGNVGIGTAAPSKKLYVIGDAQISTTLNVGSALGSGSVVVDPDSVKAWTLAPVSSNNLFQITSGGNGLVFSAAGAFTYAPYSTANAELSITASGVSASIRDGDYFRVYDKEQDLTHFQVTPMDGTASLNFLYDGIHSSLYANTTGNIGIGTTSPYAKLAVAGQAVAEYFTATSTTGTSIFYGALSSPGLVSTSQKFGAGASASGNNSLAVGLNTTASGASSLAIGASALASQTNSIAIGASANASQSTNNIVIGNSATGGSGAVVIGTSAIGNSSATIIGSGAQATSNATVAIGNGATSGNTAVAVGRSSLATTASVALGDSAQSGSNSISIGFGSLSTGGVGSIALGKGAVTTGANQFVIGSSTSAISALYIGRGVTDASPATLTINATGGAGTDITGADLVLAGGKGTGAGLGGSLIFQTSAAGASGTTLRTLTERMRIDANGSVGIGTTTPSYALTVRNASATIAGMFQGNGSGAIGIGSLLGKGFIQAYTTDSATAVTDLILQPVNGNIGVGTTSPYAKLSVVGTVVAGNFIATSTGMSTFAGNVGIGTTNPSLKLEVSGDAVINGMRIGHGPAGTNSNMIFGTDALASDVSTFYNVAIGTGALNTLSTTGFNTAIGSYTLRFYTGSNSTGVGYNALYNVTTGNDNVAIGANAAKTLGDGSTALTSVSRGTYIGVQSRASADGVINEIAIGYQVIGNGSNSVTLGNDSITKTILKGNVGVGTSTNLIKPLTINGAMATLAEGDIFSQYDGSAGTTYPVFARYWDNNGSFQSSTYIFGNGTNSRVGIEKPGSAQISHLQVRAVKSTFDGNVGIGNTDPQQKLHVTIATDGAPVRFEDSNGYCEINPTSTTWTCTSDERLKKDIVALTATSSLDALAQLRPVTFKWKNQTTNTNRYGLIAQEVEQVFPELVTTDSNGYKSVSYGSFTPFMISAIQELNIKLESLQTPPPQNNVFADASEWATQNIAAVTGFFKNIFAKNVTTENLKVQKGIEMTDQATGEAYCLTVSGGVLQQSRGTCDNPLPVHQVQTESPQQPSQNAPATSTPEQKSEIVPVQDQQESTQVDAPDDESVVIEQEPTTEEVVDSATEIVQPDIAPSTEISETATSTPAQ